MEADHFVDLSIDGRIILQVNNKLNLFMRLNKVMKRQKGAGYSSARCSDPSR